MGPWITLARDVKNPHDLARMAGGSSSGSAAVVAGGLVPIALGSDTNGSIRVPSSFCGTFGLKPTYGRLSRAGSFPFVDSFDHLGPLARSAEDLALSFDAMQGWDPDDPAYTLRILRQRLRSGAFQRAVMTCRPEPSGRWRHGWLLIPPAGAVRWLIEEAFVSGGVGASGAALAQAVRAKGELERKLGESHPYRAIIGVT